VESRVSEVETGAGRGANSVESPERMAVVPAWSVAADADPAERATMNVRSAAVRIERLTVMPKSHVIPVGTR
jgi:alkylhydroperoxidase family enzyme